MLLDNKITATTNKTVVFLHASNVLTLKLNLDLLSYQVQISYTLKNGMRCLRVLSKSHEVTKDRKEMEEVTVSALPSLKANPLSFH